MNEHKLCVIIPTLNEEEVIEETLIRLNSILKEHNIDSEILIIDDESNDKTIEVIKNLQQTKYSNIRFIIRHPPEEKNLALATVCGFNNTNCPYICVTDGDGSHELEKIPDMYNAILTGADIVLGSRYMKGGGVVGWPLYRYVLSRGTTFITRLIFPYLTDPGNFFIIRKKVIENTSLRARGFKLSVEIIDKGKWDVLVQIPYIFTNRKHGKSKLKPTIITDFLNEILDVIVHAIKERNTRAWEEIKSIVKFTIVGASGIFVNLFILYFLTDVIGLYFMISGVIAVVGSIITNFILNDSFSFNEKKKLRLSKLKRFFTYASISTIGVIINLLFLYVLTSLLGVFYILSSFIGICAAYMWNLFFNRSITWRE